MTFVAEAQPPRMASRNSCFERRSAAAVISSIWPMSTVSSRRKSPQRLLADDEVVEEEDGGLALDLEGVVRHECIGDVLSGVDLVLEFAVFADADDVEAVENEGQRGHVAHTGEADRERGLDVACYLCDERGNFPECGPDRVEVGFVDLFDEPDRPWVF